MLLKWDFAKIADFICNTQHLTLAAVLWSAIINISQLMRSDQGFFLTTKLTHVHIQDGSLGAATKSDAN